MSSQPTGECCFCQSECNPHSQSCGNCSRILTGYSLGWNTLPYYLFPLTIKERDIKCLIDSIDVKKNSVIVYDIDDTLLDRSGKPIPQIVNTYKYAKSKGLTPVIITARPAIRENIDITVKQLHDADITNYMSIYFRELDTTDIHNYKLLSRKDIHDRGYNVEMSIGDLQWDVGEYGGIPYII